MESCYKCNKKSLILIDCKCGKKFCIKHKHAEKHNCPFDYHQEQKDKLEAKKIKINTKIILI